MGGGGGPNSIYNPEAYLRSNLTTPKDQPEIHTQTHPASLMSQPTGGAGALEAIAPYVPYIFGMLHTYGGLPLDRLHSLLKLFVVSPK